MKLQDLKNNAFYSISIFNRKKESELYRRFKANDLSNAYYEHKIWVKPIFELLELIKDTIISLNLSKDGHLDVEIEE